MTPRQYKIFMKEEKDEAQRLAEEWICPLSSKDKTVKYILRGMERFKLSQEDIPLRIKLVENPKWFTSEFFSGAVDLFAHDCVHVLLGRGLLLKDEAFVIGYTMGSTKKVSRFKRNLFMFCSKYLYPKGYRFGEEERFIFNLGIRAGSQCGEDLTKINFNDYIHRTPNGVRRLLGIDKALLIQCYEVEKRLFPDSLESQRLL